MSLDICMNIDTCRCISMNMSICINIYKKVKIWIWLHTDNVSRVRNVYVCNLLKSIFISYIYIYICIYIYLYHFTVGNPIKQDVKKGKLREFSKVHQYHHCETVPYSTSFGSDNLQNNQNLDLKNSTSQVLRIRILVI
jgi:hypothetical protein